MRRSQHDPITELERHALRIELPFDEPCRRPTRLSGVRWNATGHPLRVTANRHASNWRIVCAGERCTAPSIRPSCAENSTPAVAGGAHRLRVSAVRRALPPPAPLRRLQCVRAFDRTRRQLSGLRHRHPARRSAWTGGDHHILIGEAAATGDGHDALFAQGLDNPCGGSPHDHTRYYDDGPSGLETRVL
jgi:hypothetical protein